MRGSYRRLVIESRLKCFEVSPSCPLPTFTPALIGPERAYKGENGRTVRWFGDFDIKTLEDLATDWISTPSLIKKLPLHRGEAILACCLKDGLLTGRYR